MSITRQQDKRRALLLEICQIIEIVLLTKWVGDIVGIWTDEGWLYLAALLDTYSRFIVGWAMSVYRDEALVTDALWMALARRELPPDTDLIQHTDRGSQYTADDY